MGTPCRDSGPGSTGPTAALQSASAILAMASTNFIDITSTVLPVTAVTIENLGKLVRPDFVGTAFCLSPGVFVTAGHVAPEALGADAPDPAHEPRAGAHGSGVVRLSARTHGACRSWPRSRPSLRCRARIRSAGAPVLFTHGDTMAVVGMVLGSSTIEYRGMAQQVGVASVSDEILALRRVLIAALRQRGFEGPFSGGKHEFMVKHDIVLTVPKAKSRRDSCREARLGRSRTA
ncbi:MAG: hypothetical protein AB7I50_05750 [Vicinamibacterales bacterium]